jgi:hypothetical protein
MGPNSNNTSSSSSSRRGIPLWLMGKRLFWKMTNNKVNNKANNTNRRRKRKKREKTMIPMMTLMMVIHFSKKLEVAEDKLLRTSFQEPRSIWDNNNERKREDVESDSVAKKLFKLLIN